MSQQSDAVIVGAPERPDEGPIVCKSVGRVGVAIEVAPQKSRMPLAMLRDAIGWGITIDNAGWLQFGNLGQGVTYRVVGVTNEDPVAWGNTILELERIV